MITKHAIQSSRVLAKFILLALLAILIQSQIPLTANASILEYNDFLALDNDDPSLDNLHVSTLPIHPNIKEHPHQHRYKTQLINRITITPSQRAPPIISQLF